MWSEKKYLVPNSNHEIIISSNVLKLFSHYLQKGNEPESGGLLFAEINLPKILIKKASKPNKSDERCRCLFKPDQLKQQILINSMFKKQLHFVGEWHTHPEMKPTPSILDLQSMKVSFLKSKHELNYFLMIIIGNNPLEIKMWVGLHNEKKYIELSKQ